MSDIAFYGKANGEHCDPDCQFFRPTQDGIPEHVQKAYPMVRHAACLFFGPLWAKQEGTGFVLPDKVKRAQQCIELAVAKED